MEKSESAGDSFLGFGGKPFCQMDFEKRRGGEDKKYRRSDGGIDLEGVRTRKGSLGKAKDFSCKTLPHASFDGSDGGLGVIAEETGYEKF
jgi:hypothetical protein